MKGEVSGKCRISLKGVLFIIVFFPWRYNPNLGLSLSPWNFPFHFSFLDLRQLVELIGRVISSLQCLYLCTNTEKRTRSWLPSERRQCMPQTARVPWPAFIIVRVGKFKRLVRACTVQYSAVQPKHGVFAVRDHCIICRLR
jgi:hypothetical protein